jgi:hypothetical protein
VVLTETASVAAAAFAATGAVAPATGRSATAVDVAKLHAQARVARSVMREPRRRRRVPGGPIFRSG